MSRPGEPFAFLRSLWPRPDGAGGDRASGEGPIVLAERWVLPKLPGAAEPVLGHDRVLDRPVRVVLVPPGGEAVRERARALVRMVHPHLVRAHTVHALGERELLVVDAPHGTSFAELVEGEAVRPARVVDLGLALLEGLAWAHDHGVVHGDLTAEHVIVDVEGVLVVDSFPLSVPTLGPADDVRAAGLVLAGLAHHHYPADLDSPPAALPPSLARVLRSMAEGGFLGAGPARDALARIRRIGESAGRAPRRPPWAAVGEVPASPVKSAAPAVAPPPVFEGSDPDTDVEAVERTDPGRGRITAPARIVLLPPAGSGTPLPPVPSPRRPPAAAPAPERAAAAPAAIVVPPPRVPVAPPPGMVRITPSSAPSFFLDRSPVTHRMWSEYLEATGAAPPPHWVGRRVPAGRQLVPMVGVTMQEARAYAAWRKARLPTEAEWLGAAGEDAGRRFPWGEAACGAASCVCNRVGAVDVEPVGQHPASATPEGVEDLLGNVWEYVESPGAAPGRVLVLGGSFRHPCKEPGRVPRTEIGEHSAYLYVGFRCAADAEPAP